MRLRLLSILFLSCMAVTACVSAADEAGPTQDEFDEKLEGVPSDPESYELTIISCVNDGEFVTYNWGLKNLGDERQTFAFDPYLTSSSGVEEKSTRHLVGESIAPGEYMEWDGFAGGGERFPVGDVECRFEVVDSVLGAFRDEE